jgi:hypothetical protein
MGNSLATEVVLLGKLGRYDVKNNVRPFLSDTSWDGGKLVNNYGSAL